ncbi:ABC transporter substrate-binding protein [Cohnella abietis]|uniref:Bicyclomycin resistance protein n=1 Tax=Cohnella abietis TaxID=2507935 RepID=A0A3T1CZM9_9BACL|nr:extracellular solute-binding protein [Cohnella abietis]BBI31303.1 bicyclomycin resistance protein [Cohnella abietis]
MKKWYSKLSLVMLTAVLMAGVLAACGSNSEKNSENSPSASGSPSKAPSGKKEKLVYYGFSEWVTDPNYAPVFEELKNKFESENPGFEVEFQSDPWGTWETKYKVMFASGNEPDVFIVNNPDFPTFANAGYLLDLDASLGADSFTDFFPGILDMYKWNGKNMALPYTTDARVLWYNKEIFKQAGLDPEKPPATWSELKEYALQISKATNGKVAGFGMDLGLQAFPAESLFTASNGSIIQVDGSGNITPTVNTAEFKDYLQLLTDMKPAYEADYSTLDHHKVGTLFAQQKVAMVIAGTWVTDQNEDLKNATFYGQALVPKFNESAPNGSFGGGFGIGVSAKSKHSKEAVKLAQMLTSVDFNARTMSDVPANNSSLAVSKFATDPAYKIFMDQIKFARQSQPKTLFYKEIDSAVYDSVSKVIINGLSIEDGIKDLENKMNKVISEK